MKEQYIMTNACIFKQVKVGVYSETTTLQFFIIIKNSVLFLRWLCVIENRSTFAKARILLIHDFKLVAEVVRNETSILDPCFSLYLETAARR